MARFSGIPEIPEGLGQEWAPALIGALKQNVELLAGIRGEVIGGKCISNMDQIKIHARASALVRYSHQCCSVGWRARAARPPCNRQLCLFTNYLMDAFACVQSPTLGGSVVVAMPNSVCELSAYACKASDQDLHTVTLERACRPPHCSFVIGVF